MPRHEWGQGATKFQTFFGKEMGNLTCNIQTRDPPVDHHMIFPYGYGSIPINTIFRGMNIHLPAIFDVHQGYKVLTHCHIYIYISHKVVGLFFVRYFRTHLETEIGPATSCNQFRPEFQSARVVTQCQNDEGDLLERATSSLLSIHYWPLLVDKSLDMTRV